MKLKKLKIWLNWYLIPTIKDAFSQKESLSEKARKFAFKLHSGTNHKYDGMSYSIHLRIVLSFAYKYIHLIPFEDRELVLAACWCHDTIEDTRVTYNDVKSVLGEKVADIVYSLSNEKGKTRKERANEKYYRGIIDTEYSVFCKLCDRFGNKSYSKNIGSRMYSMYKKEHKHFSESIYDDRYKEMFDDLYKY